MNYPINPIFHEHNIILSLFTNSVMLQCDLPPKYFPSLYKSPNLHCTISAQATITSHMDNYNCLQTGLFTFSSSLIHSPEGSFANESLIKSLPFKKLPWFPFSSVLLLFRCLVISMPDSATPWTAAHEDSLFFTIPLRTQLKKAKTKKTLKSPHKIHHNMKSGCLPLFGVAVSHQVHFRIQLFALAIICVGSALSVPPSPG